MPPAVRERLSGRSVLPPRAALVLCPVKAAAQLCVRTKAIRDVRGRKTWPSSCCFQFGDAWCCGGACRWVGAVLRRCLPRRRRRRHRRRRRPSLVPSRVVHKANTALRALLGPSPAQVRVDDLPGRLIGGCSAAWRASISAGVFMCFPPPASKLLTPPKQERAQFLASPSPSPRPPLPMALQCAVSAVSLTCDECV